MNSKRRLKNKDRKKHLLDLEDSSNNLKISRISQREDESKYEDLVRREIPRLLKSRSLKKVDKTDLLRSNKMYINIHLGSCIISPNITGVGRSKNSIRAIN